MKFTKYNGAWYIIKATTKKRKKVRENKFYILDKLYLKKKMFFPPIFLSRLKKWTFRNGKPIFLLLTQKRTFGMFILQKLFGSFGLISVICHFWTLECQTIVLLPTIRCWKIEIKKKNNRLLKMLRTESKKGYENLSRHSFINSF